MFSKDSKALETPVAPEGLLEIRSARASSGVPSIISADLKIVGDLSSSGDLQIDGAVEGSITSRSLTIGESAVVQGTLVAEEVRIYGAVFGEVKANTVMLAGTAKVEGDIVHQSLAMEAGAILAGRLSRLETAVGGGARPGPAAAGASSEKASHKSNGSGAASASGGSHTKSR